MKKTLVLIVIIGLFFLTKDDIILIPNSAIRFRVIANSNTSNDQGVKLSVKNAVQNKMLNDLNNVENVNAARTVLKNNTNSYSKIVEKTLLNNHISSNYTINYGMNYFPEKKYKGVEYPEGYYESLVITLGNGLGDNWWCVLFPPLCLLEAEEEDTNNVKYRFFIKELIDKYFN